MAKKRTFAGYRPAGLRLRGRELSDEVFAEICAEIKRWPPKPITACAELRTRMELAVTVYRLTSSAQAKPTAHQISSVFDEIEALAGKLAESIHAAAIMEDRLAAVPFSLVEGLTKAARAEAKRLNADGDTGGRVFASGLVRDAARAVLNLQAWSREASKSAGAEADTGAGFVHEGNEALQEFTDAMMKCWRDVIGREPDQGKEFKGFMQRAYNSIGDKPTIEAVRERIRAAVAHGRGKSKP